VFKVPVGTCAPASSDGAVSFSVAVNSLAGGAGTAPGSINVDTKGPVSGNLVVSYPTVDSGPLGWSHDGTHFNRRDTATFAFSAYDCHGLAASPVSVSGLGTVTPTPSTDTSGVLNPASTCASPA